jgi:hypothetical protein
MTGLTNREAREWCERNGVPLSGEKPDTSQLGTAVHFSIPDRCAARVLLARTLYPDTFDVGGTVLIWTKEWGIWPSSEHLPLFTRFRQALGEPRSLSAANAHLFESGQAEDGESLTILNCMFLWDCWLISEGGQYVLHLSHDEWGELFAEPAVLERARKYLSDAGLIS